MDSDFTSPYELTIAELASLRVSEEVASADVEKLAGAIARAGCWTTPVPAERGTGIIMDGNHRWHAARLLGLTHVPCVFLGYDDARVRVLHWNDGGAYPVARIRATVSSGAVLPYKTTRHLFAPALPAIAVALSTLRAPGAGRRSAQPVADAILSRY